MLVLLLLCKICVVLGSVVGENCSSAVTVCNTPGQFCDTGNVVGGGANTCQLAQAGYYATGDGTQQVPGAGNCASAAGSSCSAATGATTTFACTGTSYQTDSTNPVTACSTCNQNVNGCGGSSAGTCAAGYYGTASVADCTACPAGFFKAASGDGAVGTVCVTPGAGKCASTDGASCETGTGADQTFACTGTKYQTATSGAVTACSDCNQNVNGCGGSSAGTCAAGY